jgi:hypothetical protein
VSCVASGVWPRSAASADRRNRTRKRAGSAPECQGEWGAVLGDRTSAGVVGWPAEGATKLCLPGVRRQGRWARWPVQSRAWSKSCREVCCGVLMWCRARAHDRGGSRYTAVQWLVARSGRRGRHRLGVAWVLRCTNSSGGSPGEGASYSGYGMLSGLVCGTERMSGARGGRSLVWSGLDWKDG